MSVILDIFDKFWLLKWYPLWYPPLQAADDWHKPTDIRDTPGTPTQLPSVSRVEFPVRAGELESCSAQNSPTETKVYNFNRETFQIKEHLRKYREISWTKNLFFIQVISFSESWIRWWYNKVYLHFIFIYVNYVN